MDYKFYDTSSLLLRAEDLFTKEEDKYIAISSITLKELENIKTSIHKSPEIKSAARHLLNLLDNSDIEVIIYKDQFEEYIIGKGLPLNDDMRILACAVFFDELHPDEVIFVSNDISLKVIASLFFGQDCITSVQEEEDDYSGYSDITLDEEEMSDFYQNLHSNVGNNVINSYLIVRNAEG